MARQDVVGGNGLGALTQAAGTAIRRVIPGLVAAIARISKLVYTNGATLHTVTIARPIGSTRTSGAGASGQAVINLVADPGPSGNALAANDLLVIQEADGVQRLYIVSAVSSLAITLTANLVAGVAANAWVWNFGILGDTDPRIGEAHQTLSLPASGTTTYSDDMGGVIGGHRKNEPLLVSVNNITNAGTLNQLSWFYTREAIPG